MGHKESKCELKKGQFQSNLLAAARFGMGPFTQDS